MVERINILRNIGQFDSVSPNQKATALSKLALIYAENGRGKTTLANSRDAVERFYNKALELGAQDNGKPGLRDYEEGYFAAFVIDPNGHNIEAVYSERKV